jgi:hypothetical protein
MWHESFTQSVSAPPDLVRQALGEVTLGDMPLFRALITARLLPRLLTGSPLPDPVVPLVNVLDAEGFVLLSPPGAAQLVLGSVDQPWTASAPSRRLHGGAQEFFAFAEPGYVKITFDVRVEADGTRSAMHTETRVQATDARAACRFRLYWTPVRWGSALTRRSLLAAVRRRAEAAAGTASPSPSSARRSLHPESTR